MTPEAQRIAIAEACGWTTAFPTDKGMLLLPYKWHNAKTGENRVELPSYLTDLNAMHEAEKVLATLSVQMSSNPGDYKEWMYAAHLIKILGFKTADPISCPRMFVLIHATAAQRAEAFLRTINKWDDTK